MYRYMLAHYKLHRITVVATMEGNKWMQRLSDNLSVTAILQFTDPWNDLQNVHICSDQQDTVSM